MRTSETLGFPTNSINGVDTEKQTEKRELEPWAALGGLAPTESPYAEYPKND